jgi:dGTPase
MELLSSGRLAFVAGDERHRLRCIGDFIAGMTDRYAVEFYQRLTSGPSVSIFKDVSRSAP